MSARTSRSMRGSRGLPRGPAGFLREGDQPVEYGTAQKSFEQLLVLAQPGGIGQNLIRSPSWARRVSPSPLRRAPSKLNNSDPTKVSRELLALVRLKTSNTGSK